MMRIMTWITGKNDNALIDSPVVLFSIIYSARNANQIII